MGRAGAGGAGHSLRALGRLALALVVQDTLDQVVVLVQHLKEKQTGAPHGDASSSAIPARGRKPPGGAVGPELPARFTWGQVEGSPTIRTVGLFLQSNSQRKQQ